MFTLFVYLLSIGFLTYIRSGGLQTQRGAGSSPGMVNRQTTPIYILPIGPSEGCEFELRYGQQTDNSNHPLYIPQIGDTEENDLISISNFGVYLYAS